MKGERGTGMPRCARLPVVAYTIYEELLRGQPRVGDDTPIVAGQQRVSEAVTIEASKTSAKHDRCNGHALRRLAVLAPPTFASFPVRFRTLC